MSAEKFSWFTVLEILLGTFGSGLILTLLAIVLGKWISKMKDHFEATA